MIQRIQTLFLLLIVALAAGLFFYHVFVSTTTAPGVAVQQVSYMIQSNWLTAVVVALSGLIALVSIFLYRDRQKQTLLCRLNLLFFAAAIGLILQAADTSSLPRSEQVTIQYSYAVYFPIAQIILDLLALRYIKKDDDLVKSADRLR